MEQTAHTFTPQDSSLAERIRAYLRVATDLSHFNERRKQHHHDEWLGDKEDIAIAQQILQNGLSEAYRQITDKDVAQAHQEGLMTADEVRVFLQEKRAREIRNRREESEQLSQNHTLRR